MTGRWRKGDNENKINKNGRAGERDGGEMEGGWGEGANERSEKDEKEIERNKMGKEERTDIEAGERELVVRGINDE